MSCLVSILLITITLSSPLAVLAEESSTTEAEPALSNEILELYVPVYLFSVENGGILGVTPVAENLQIWTYATTSENAAISFIDPTRTEYEVIVIGVRYLFFSC